MSSEHLKYDVRVRERMLAKGLLSEAEVKNYLEALKDVEGESRSISLAQPALAHGAASDEYDDDDDDDDEAPESAERP